MDEQRTKLEGTRNQTGKERGEKREQLHRVWVQRQGKGLLQGWLPAPPSLLTCILICVPHSPSRAQASSTPHQPC